MSRCVITCAAPGCRNQIPYDPDKDNYVSLYCAVHRTTTGRHAAMRRLRKAKPPDAPDLVVIMKCPRCHLRREVSERVWKGDAPVVCECGKTMLYHKTMGEEHIDGVRR